MLIFVVSLTYKSGKPNVLHLLYMFHWLLWLMLTFFIWNFFNSWTTLLTIMINMKFQYGVMESDIWQHTIEQLPQFVTKNFQDHLKRFGFW